MAFTYSSMRLLRTEAMACTTRGSSAASVHDRPRRPHEPSSAASRHAAQARARMASEQAATASPGASSFVMTGLLECPQRCAIAVPHVRARHVAVTRAGIALRMGPGADPAAPPAQRLRICLRRRPFPGETWWHADWSIGFIVIPKPPFACDLDLETEITAFDALKPRLAGLWGTI